MEPITDPDTVQGFRVSASNSRKNSLNSSGEQEDELTQESLQKVLDEQLPKPEDIKTLAAAREKIVALNGLIKVARSDLLKAYNAAVTLNEQLEKHREINRYLSFQMLKETKGSLTGALDMFTQGMHHMTFSMSQWMSDKDTIQEILIPLVRWFTKQDFNCGGGSVYMALHTRGKGEARTPMDKFLTEWDYGVTIQTVSKKVTMMVDPPNLFDWFDNDKEYDSVEDTFDTLFRAINEADKAMLKWILENEREILDVEVQGIKNMLAELE